jgi:putative hydrolase of the HAD superfamily
VSDRNVRGILVDLDETLYSREAAFWSWIEFESGDLAAPGRLDRAEVARLDQRGRGDKHTLLEYLDGVLRWNEEPPQRMHRFRTGITAAARLSPGVREMLARVARRHPLGLVTNGTSAMQRAKIASLGVGTLFDPIVISEEVGLRKPDRRIFERAISDWSVTPDSVLFVGDDPIADIEGARGAGMQALRVGHEDGIASIEHLENWLDRA